MSEYKKIILTGASGMLGRATIRKWLAKVGDCTVYAVVRPGSEHNRDLALDSRVQVIECSLDSLEHLPEQLSETCDVFYHFGWAGTKGDTRNDLYAQLDNVRYTLDAVKAADRLGCQVFVGAGSQAEYGRVPEHTKLSQSVPARPETGYGIAKLCAGQMSRNLCREYQMRHEWFRILSVYGPYDKPYTMVMSGINAMLAGERPKYTKGEQLWDYLHCDDAAEAFYRAAIQGRDGAVYSLGSGSVRPLKEYMMKIRDAAAPDMEVVFGEVPYFDKQVMYLCADISDLTEDTGFVPAISFEEGIRQTVDWCKGQSK